MVLQISDKVSIVQKYSPVEMAMESLSADECISTNVFSFDRNLTTIIIKGVEYRVIPMPEVCRSANKKDGYYRLIYIQINMSTLEYYIGKVNRSSWREIRRYPGSGLKFRKKYEKHKNEFVRYYIANCETAEETEELEAAIVDNELLEDPKCLNLVQGGGGTNKHPMAEETRQKHKEYMQAHPEQYQAMLVKCKELYSAGNSRELISRGQKIKETMSDPKYRNMMGERIRRWRRDNPEAYAKARINNRLAQQTPETIQKKKEAQKKWREENPEKFELNEERRKAACQTEEVRAKRAESLKEWNELHPEQAYINQKKRSKASVEVCRKKVNMIDLVTGDVIMTFDSQHEAARWLVDKGIAKNINCVSSISSVCLKKPCTTGYGYRKKAYGYGWEFANHEI